MPNPDQFCANKLQSPYETLYFGDLDGEEWEKDTYGS